MKKTSFRGIQGVEGRQPVAASVQISRRLKAGGVPMEKEGFHILTEREDEGMRLQHPQFRFFNGVSFKDRQILYGVLVHSTEEEIFEWQRKAPIIRKPMHPYKMPHCVGDGIRARRWSFGEPDEFLDIECLGEQCEFSQGRNRACKPWMRFLFLVVWPQAKEKRPSVLCKFTSRSWNTVENFVGFFKYIHKTAKAMHLEDYSLMGYPFSIEHTFQTKPDKGWRYQVVKITQSLEPSEFFYAQQKRLEAIHGQRFTAITDQSEQNPETVFRDVKNVSWGDSTE